jgi:hypothetical protein
VVLHANGCDPSARWDQVFKKQIEELANDITCTSDYSFKPISDNTIA